MQRITKIAISYGNATTFTLTTEGISPSYDAKPYQPEMLQEVISVWKRHFASAAPLTLPTPETVDERNYEKHLDNIVNFTTMLTSDTTTAANPVPVLSGLLFDVASLLAIEEKLAALDA